MRDASPLVTARRVRKIPAPMKAMAPANRHGWVAAVTMRSNSARRNATSVSMAMMFCMADSLERIDGRVEARADGTLTRDQQLAPAGSLTDWQLSLRSCVDRETGFSPRREAPREVGDVGVAERLQCLRGQR